LVMAVEVRLKIPWSMHSQVNGLSRRQTELVEAS